MKFWMNEQDVGRVMMNAIKSQEQRNLDDGRRRNDVSIVDASIV